MARTAILYIAKRCNQSCVFCLEEDGEWAPFVDPETTAVTDEVERLYARGARHITFMGGETFFRKDLGPILTHAKRTGFTRVGVTTNGTVFSKPGFIGGLRDAGLDFIELSVHGHTEELANLIAGTHYTHARQSLALDELRAAGVPTILNLVVCRENKDHLVEIVRYVADRLAGTPLRFKLKFVSLQGLALERAAPLAYEEVDVGPVGDELAARDIPFWLYNFPLCRAGRHAGRAHELGITAADESYFDYDHWSGRGGYYDSAFQLGGRVWPTTPCGGCTVRALCPGLEESYRRVHGAGALAARGDDPLPLLRFARQDRGLDPAGAEAQLGALQAVARPASFIAPTDERLLHFSKQGQPHPLVLEIAEAKPEQKAWAKTARFALGYRRWPEGEASQAPGAQSLLEAARRALEEAERASADLRGARARVAALEVEGWKGAPTPDAPRARRLLPLLGDAGGNAGGSAGGNAAPR